MFLGLLLGLDGIVLANVRLMGNLEFSLLSIGWQYKNRPRRSIELITVVEDVFGELHPKTLTNAWISLQHHLNEILKVKGCNDYIQPHFGKKIQEDNSRLRIQVRIPTQLVREVVAFLNPNRDQQQTQALTENEDAAQTTEIIQEAYDQAIEETQG